MRTRLLAALATLTIVAGLPSCGKPPAACDGDTLMPEAHACPDRASLGFGREFDTATRIGTSPINTISVRNGGLKDLTVTKASISGDGAFRLTTAPAELPATIKGNQYFFMQVAFSPTQAKLYCATLTLESDGANADGGVQVFPLSGCGVPTDGGTSPCFGRPDAGELACP